MLKQSFITTQGREISFIPRYLEAHPQSNPNPARYLETRDKSPAPSFRVGFHEFFKDYFEFCMLIDFMASLGQDNHYGRTLDVGGREGVVARFFKGTGRTRVAETLDILDFSKALSEHLFYKYFIEIKGRVSISSLLGFRESLAQPLVESFGYSPGPGAALWTTELIDRPLLDAFRLEDFYGIEPGYDFISALFCLDYFDLGQFFAKAHSLLERGGLLCIMVNYWWWPVNGTRIVGDFPYAAQRLPEEDLVRYFREHRPELAKRVSDLCRYFHQGRYRPTVDQYVELGLKSGFDILGARRLMPWGDTHPTTPLPPKVLNTEHPGLLEAVLEDIQQFRPDVGMADLFTQRMICAFKKR